MRRPGQRLAAALALAAGLLGPAAAVAAGPAPALGPALAHEALADTSPKEGSWVARRPAQIVMTFIAPPEQLGAAMSVTDAAGRPVLAGVPRIDGVTLVADLQPAPAEGADGAYTVTWRVTAADGHPLSGRFSFGVGSPGSATLAPSQQSTTPTGGGGKTLLVAVLVSGVGGVVLLLVVRFVLVRRRPDEPEQAADPTSEGPRRPPGSSTS